MLDSHFRGEESLVFVPTLRVARIFFVKPDLFLFPSVWLLWPLKVSSLSAGCALTAGPNCEVRLAAPEATGRVVIKDLYSSCLHISSNSSRSNGNELGRTYEYQVAACLQPPLLFFPSFFSFFDKALSGGGVIGSGAHKKNNLPVNFPWLLGKYLSQIVDE